MKQLFCLIFWLAGKVHAEFAEGVRIDLRQNYGGMNLGITEIGKVRHRAGGDLAVRRSDGERDQDLVGMKARIVIAEIFDFQLLNRLQNLMGDNIRLFTCLLYTSPSPRD